MPYLVQERDVRTKSGNGIAGTDELLHTPSLSWIYKVWKEYNQNREWDKEKLVSGI